MESKNTRPTLDRVKESLFNIINQRISDSIVLDLFAGSGAIGIEFMSRGCKKAYMCDKSNEAIKFIKKNVDKTRLNENAVIANKDYKDFLMDLYKSEQKFDIIFIDPPYDLDISTEAVELIIKYKLLSNDGIIIVETDQKEREIKKLQEMQIEIYDTRKYGRVNLIFLVERG